MQGEKPVEIFSNLFPDIFIDEIVFETKFYAGQKEKDNFGKLLTSVAIPFI